MKQLFFFLAMLTSVAASATVTVMPLSADYSAKQVTFKVAWTNSPSAPHNNRVWIWIDFCPVTGTQQVVTFSPATITNPAKTGGNGTITGLNGRGFFIEHAATNAGTTVTATLSNAPAGKFNWCAYGSDYPPNVLANTNGSYTFAGTPPFTLIASNGTTKQTVEKIIAISAVTVTPSTITDITGYLGLWCPYTGSDLIMDATHRCTQRQSGAMNWEAWIKDTRDSKFYRIVYMPDNKWWLAQNLDYRNGSYRCANDNSANCNKYGIMINMYAAVSPTTLCPSGWRLPTTAEWKNIAPDASEINRLRSTTTWLGSSTSSSYRGIDYYGFSILATGFHNYPPDQTYYYCEGYASMQMSICTDCSPDTPKPVWVAGSCPAPGCINGCEYTILGVYHQTSSYSYIRCLR
jgi:uncharacterized protein (TIGR02145 family)